jgi:hypothetical protein
MLALTATTMSEHDATRLHITALALTKQFAVNFNQI